MSNARQLRLKIDALKQEHANLPYDVPHKSDSKIA